VQATTLRGSAKTGPTANGTASAGLAGDLYALVVYLHKNCNSDLFEAVGALELSLTQIKLLHHLEGAERELTLKEAADLVLISLAAASRTVDDLVRRGFVARHEDAVDRRMKRISLTDAGLSVSRRLNAARLNGLEQFIGTLTDTERDKIAAALKELLVREDVAACRPETETE
jgi:DNA-binding MarR family transcriptional regulator